MNKTKLLKRDIFSNFFQPAFIEVVWNLFTQIPKKLASTNYLIIIKGN